LTFFADGNLNTDQQKDIQPNINNTPPIGVTIPNALTPVSAIKYKLPLNKITPAQNKKAVLLTLRLLGNNPQANSASACVL